MDEKKPESWRSRIKDYRESHRTPDCANETPLKMALKAVRRWLVIPIVENGKSRLKN